ncbi:S27A2 synthetase, partial [Centropus unirufus]|nr:S27A2 synthetase [Centropus unirufus]
RRLGQRPPKTLLDVFQAHAKRRPWWPLILFQDEVLTYRDVDTKSNQAARVFSELLGNRGGGQTVAVVLPNGPTYVWTWLALAKLGCAMACVNVNARGRALRHAVRAADARVVLSSRG